jgi:hypothetical protein
MKVSKASFMILGAGVFIIALAGLGVARSGQVQEQKLLNQDLSVNNARMNNLQVTPFEAQINELEEEAANAQSQTAEIKKRLQQTIISVDVADKFYEIADYYSVNITSISTSSISEKPYADIDCETISLSASVTGAMEDIISFVKGLNDNFATGFVKSAQLGFGDLASSTVSVQMSVYSYKGNQDGD